MTDEDLNLIHKAKIGDVSAYNELYQNYYQFVYRYAWQLSKKEADARDITQEVFLQVYKSLPNLRDDNLFVPWLRKITNSKCQLIFRKNKDVLYDSDQISTELGKEKRKEFVPQDYIRFMSDKEILIYLLSQLSEKKRTVLDMFYLQQMSLNEIAEAMDINVNTVKGRLHEARKALLKVVSEFEDREGRKITFRLDPIPSVGVIGLLYDKWDFLFRGNAYRLLQAVAVMICALSGSMAIKETYEIYHTEEVDSATTDQTVKKDAKVIFHSVVYHDQMVDSTKEAFFIIMDFAKDKDLLAGKSKQELTEIRPVVEELCSSDNAYCEELINSGWIQKFEELL